MPREGRAGDPYETPKVHEVPSGCILLIGVSCEKQLPIIIRNGRELIARR